MFQFFQQYGISMVIVFHRSGVKVFLVILSSHNLAEPFVLYLVSCSSNIYQYCSFHCTLYLVDYYGAEYKKTSFIKGGIGKVKIGLNVGD